MPMSTEVIIGLEIHAQVNTKTKFFCDCDNDSFGKEPNCNTCPICMGFPGTLPVPNAEAIDKSVLTALALQCTINPSCKFDRKNYFYPDLPFGFQISQFDEPLSEHGTVEIPLPDGTMKKIGITRLHMENDAGKLMHADSYSLCDYNRAGTPLMEIVTEPDFRSPEEAEIFARNLQAILQTVESSDADMEKGMMRFDASISVREIGSNKLNPRAEIKNLNSFKALKEALTYEMERQIALFEEGTVLENDITVGWRENLGKTVLLRNKESASDYRYFPEPDIPPLTFTEGYIQEMREQMPELPLEKVERYGSKFNLSNDITLMIAYDHKLSGLFDYAVRNGISPELAANTITSVLTGILKDRKISHQDIAFSQGEFVELLQMIENNSVSKTAAKDVLMDMVIKGGKPGDIVKSKGLEQLSDTSEIESFCKEAIENNPQAVVSYNNGKDRALGALVGYVMGKTKGKANPKMVNDIILKLIKNG